jgi:hypothetical protein
MQVCISTGTDMDMNNNEEDDLFLTIRTIVSPFRR